MSAASLAAARAQLAPSGVLRAAINMSNILLVTGRGPAGEPEGVAPDMAKAVASRLGVPSQLLPYAHPHQLCDAAPTGAWDVGLVGADPDRAQHIDFTAPYCEIQATYMVAASSQQSLTDVDRPGARIAVKGGGAYDLWLSRNLKHATLVRAETLDGSFDVFHEQGLDALAGLRPKLVADLAKAPGYRILDGHFMAVQQAVGCLKSRDDGGAGLDFLSAFVEEAKVSGLVQQLIDLHGVTGRLSVAASVP